MQTTFVAIGALRAKIVHPPSIKAVCKILAVSQMRKENS